MKWASQAPLRVALLDDHPLIRNGFAERFERERDIKVVALYATSRELLTALRSVTIDVLVLDYSLQQNELDGLNLIGLLRVRFPAVRILVSSATELPAIISLSLRAGASGFIGKSQDLDALLGAVRAVGKGQRYVDPAVAHALEQVPPVDEVVRSASDVEAGVPGELPATAQGLVSNPRLSVREQEVLRCCLEGLSVSQIAVKFSRSIKTISAQKHAAFRKLGIRSDIELFKIDSALGKP